jgi:hypothetical protein
MLLSIDKVLHLIYEGKDVAKISALAGVSEDEVRAIIDDARALLLKHEKGPSRKKILIRKKSTRSDGSARTEEEMSEDKKPPFLEGVELTAVPVEDTMVINIAAIEEDNMCALAIIMHDANDHQLGKVYYSLSRITARKALVKAALRSFEIAKYFRSKVLKIRVNDEIFVKQISGDITINDPDMKKIFDEFRRYTSEGTLSIRWEAVNELQNEKAVFLARKSFASKR